MFLNREKRYPGDDISGYISKEFPFPAFAIESLTQASAVVREGGEKIVYHMTDGTNIIAAKIFGTETDHVEKVDIQAAALTELENYTKARLTALVSYVPEPLGLLTQNNIVIGTTIAWEEGDELQRLRTRIPAEEIDALYEAVIASKLMISADTLGPSNICYDAARVPSLWFAEIGIYSGLPTPDYYRHLEIYFDYMRAQHQI